jgi:hypothetical protein
MNEYRFLGEECKASQVGHSHDIERFAKERLGQQANYDCLKPKDTFTVSRRSQTNPS